MVKKKKSRYKQTNGQHWIEVRVKNAQQLFDARDPAPFRERDLDDDFVDYIVAAIRELSGSKLRIVIYIEDSDLKELTLDSIKEAIEADIEYRIDLLNAELNTYFKRVPIVFITSLIALFVCLGISQSIDTTTTHNLNSVVKEGLVIFGWVSVWKPIELLLFDWYPIFEKRRIFLKFKKSEIKIHLGQS